MISSSQRKNSKKFCFFAENQLLRERFKVTLKEVCKEKIILNFFSTISIFLSRHVLVWWYVLKSISWVHSTRFQWKLGHIQRSELIFSQNMKELAFFPPNEKIELFFQKSKIDLYMAQIDESLLWIESTHIEDVSKLLLWYSIFKTFFFIFWLKNENYAWFLNKIA